MVTYPGGDFQNGGARDRQVKAREVFLTAPIVAQICLGVESLLRREPDEPNAAPEPA